jgi:hypothetical protein
MFPMTVTVNNQSQLAAVIAALGLPAIEMPSSAKAETEPSKKAQAGVAPNTVSDGAPVVPEASPATDSAVPFFTAAAVTPITYDQVKPWITGWTKGREALVALLAEFGAKRGTDLTPEQYADFIARAKA